MTNMMQKIGAWSLKQTGRENDDGDGSNDDGSDVAAADVEIDGCGNDERNEK